MTGGGRPDDFESANSASDDELADELAIDDVVDHPDAASDSAAVASTPPRTGARHSLRRRSTAPEENLRAEQFSPPVPPEGWQSETDAAKGRWWHRRKKAGEPKQRKKAPWWELPALVLFAMLIAILVKTFVIQPFYIPSASMEKTLAGSPELGHDRILVNKVIYDLRDPHPGDIVVFHAPAGWNEAPKPTVPSNPIVKVVRGFGQLIGFIPPDDLVLVKRVIAIGGQTVRGDSSGAVEISDNGTAGPWRTLNEPYVYESGADGHAQFGPVTVPKGRLWVMGDHRNDSADSRYHCDGSGAGTNFGQTCDPTTSTVPISAVIGKAFLVAWPPSHWRTLGTPSTFTHAALSAGGAVPVLGSAAVVVPVWLLRRRRRRIR